ncbi:MAG: DUF72 domain-containing protein [Gemmatimonadetes bacterium]|nr:DUF72 domain-containing protein [Gemmatimonadota bacterium]NIR79026.1 DUF72 domain-containing protein [Gemmatimonadota bacterium]NIT87675.1 DUF72 domain-containing protein [Gemmatimonadota bacterium]NIU31544.1 DUF72 domain-containing protein [Gemmatimonadota bacterium]NIU36196.1 DUF72 domain-containing protein [Gemmatimonadota bacterium]
MVRIGTAGWSLARKWQDRFPDGYSHLERYASVLSACELDRAFRTMPRDGTFERWSGTVPPSFRFSVKLPREITHDRRLGPGGRGDLSHGSPGAPRRSRGPGGPPRELVRGGRRGTPRGARGGPCRRRPAPGRGRRRARRAPGDRLFPAPRHALALMEMVEVSAGS